MHLNLKIHLGSPRGPFAGLLFAALLISVLLSSWAQNSNQANAPAAAAQRKLVRRQAAETPTTQRKCQPMLNFGLPQAYAADQQRQRQSNMVKRNKTSEISNTTTTTTTTTTTGTSHQLSPKLSKSIPDIFSFPIGDIDLPLSPQTADGATGGGAVQAAMKLLATFESQIYGDSEHDDHEDGDPSEERDVGREGPSLKARNVIRFKDNKLHLAGVNLTMLNVHLYEDSEPKFAIGINIENTTLAGQFHYDGLALTAGLLGPTAGEHAKLAGHYRMSIDNVFVTLASNLTKVHSSARIFGGDGLASSSSKFHLATNELRMNISNLGYISIDILDAKDASRPTSNYVLKMLQRVLQKTIKRTYSKFEDYIRQTLEVEGRQFLDCELARLSPLLEENLQVLNASAATKPQEILATYAARDKLTALETVATNSASQQQQHQVTYLEDLAKIISAKLASSHLDRIPLPDFEYQRGVFGSQANINFVNGSLLGLDNIRLNGETRVKLLEEHLIVNASIGWVNLRPNYNWTLYFGHSRAASSGALTLMEESSGGAGSAAASSANLLLEQAGHPQEQTRATTQAKPVAKGFVAFNIKAIDFDAVISKSVRSQSQMVVDELVIRRLESPKMDIGGLPGMNRLTRSVVNFFISRLKQRLVSSIQAALKQGLEQALNRLALFD